MTKMGEDYRRLLTKTQVQLEEQKAFIRNVLLKSDLPKPKANMLIQQAGQIALLWSTIEDKNVHNLDKKPEVQVCYDFPDELYAFLMQPEEKLPAPLRGFMDNSHTLISMPTAIDTMPQTGKTKTNRERV